MNPDGEQWPDYGSLSPTRPGSPLDDLSAAPAAPSQPPPPLVPAGWYPDPDNTTGFRYGSVPSMRYFDGVSWTDQRAPMQRSPNARQQPQSHQPIYVTQQVVNAPRAPVVVVRGGTSHGFHLVLTILTCGAWLPVWIIVAIINAAR